MILWFLKILRLLFAFFDRIAFTLIEWVYELFMLIAEAGIFSQATIQEFAARIYVFLGLIMVFKVSISLVTYILNPDNFNKADVGAPALLKGFVFALLGIVLVPYVFEAAYSLQRIVLKDNLIGNLIMGMSANNNNSSNYLEDAGNQMSFVTLTAFLRLDTKFSQVSEACSADPVTVDYENKTGELSAECDGLAEVMGDDAVNLLVKAYANRSIEYLTDGDLLNVTVTTDENDDEFLMSYLPIVSTAAGIFIAYVLLLFCVDIAVRSVKLGFLQLIAPIPLIAKVDPKKGNETFGKWVKECTSTYLDVFMRLAAIYFVLFIISAITGSGNNGIYNVVTGKGYSGISGIFVKIFIIIGALNFARDLPKLLEKLFNLNMKNSGGFTLNAKKKLGATPLIGGTLAAGAGLAGRTGMNLGKGLFNATGKGIGALDNATGFNDWRANRSEAFRQTDLYKNGSAAIGKVKAGASKAGAAVNDVTGNAMKDIGADFVQFGAEAVPFLTDHARKKQDEMVNALKTYAGYKSKLKEQADFDDNKYITDASGQFMGTEAEIQRKITSGTATAAESAAFARGATSSTKSLKQAFEDLKSSGTATAADITSAREAYETAQKLSISAGEFAPISNIKREAAQYARDNALVLVDPRDSSKTINVNDEKIKYDDLNMASVSAGNKVIEVQSSSSYIRSHSVQPSKKS